jgi:hypothetical protein
VEGEDIDNGSLGGGGGDALFTSNRLPISFTASARNQHAFGGGLFGFPTTQEELLAMEGLDRTQEILVSGLAAVTTNRFIAGVRGGRGIRGAAGTGRGVATLLENGSVSLLFLNLLEFYN